MRLRILLVLAILLATVGAGLLYITAKNQKASTNYLHPDPKTEAEISSEVKPGPKRAKFLAVGDILIHDDIYEDFRSSTNVFNFEPLFKDVAPIIKSAEYAALNQETILGGKELGLSGLYVANSPQELGDAEIKAGFNIFQLANNHALDKGVEGLRRSLAYWAKQKNVITSGAYLTKAARNQVPVIEKQGIKLAYLSYTYSNNLGPPPESYQLNFIDKALIKKDVAAAKKVADVVVVGMHWGIEKQRQPSRQQRDLANYLAELEVDIVVGTHPHVLQPPAWIKKGKHKTFVMYSLGNFVSIHTELVPHTLTGAIMGVDIVKNTDGTIDLKEPFAVPTWTYFTNHETGFRIIPFDKMTQGLYYWGNWPSHQAETKSFLTSSLPELSIKKSVDFRQE
jgi:hypothetical protein